jgi:hypothetical protein
MSGVGPWVKALTERVSGGAPFKVGDDVRHFDGRMVRIVEGQYWGTRGLSNHWHWRAINVDGSLSETDEYGYGWRPSDVSIANVHTHTWKDSSDETPGFHAEYCNVCWTNRKTRTK